MAKSPIRESETELGEISPSSGALPIAAAENNALGHWSVANPIGDRCGASRLFTGIKRLKHLIGPFILRRLKTDKSIISDLPNKLEMKVYCTLTKEEGYFIFFP